MWPCSDAKNARFSSSPKKATKATWLINTLQNWWEPMANLKRKKRSKGSIRYETIFTIELFFSIPCKDPDDDEKTRQIAENKQTFDLMGKLKLSEKLVKSLKTNKLLL